MFVFLGCRAPHGTKICVELCAEAVTKCAPHAKRAADGGESRAAKYPKREASFAAHRCHPLSA